MSWSSKLLVVTIRCVNMANVSSSNTQSATYCVPMLRPFTPSESIRSRISTKPGVVKGPLTLIYPDAYMSVKMNQAK